jgi:hypothetical protein
MRWGGMEWDEGTDSAMRASSSEIWSWSLETVVVISSILSSTEVMGGMDDEESDEANLMTWER